MAEYEKPIGRFLLFPVSDVQTVETNNWLSQLFGSYATVTLFNGLKYKFTHEELDVLIKLQERWRGILEVHSIITEQKNRNGGSKQ